MSLYNLSRDGLALADELVGVSAQPAGSPFAGTRVSFVRPEHALEVAASLSKDPSWSEVRIDLGRFVVRVVDGEPQPHPHPEHLDAEERELWKQLRLPELPAV